MSKEKVWNPALWKPIGVKPVDVKDYPGKYNGQLHSFLDYQAPNDRYEVRGVMPKVPEHPKEKQLLKKFKIIRLVQTSLLFTYKYFCDTI